MKMPETVLGLTALAFMGTTLCLWGQVRGAGATGDSTGPQLCVQEGHKGVVEALAFSPDGRLLASGASDCLRLWDVATGVESLTFPYGFDRGSGYLAFTPDGRFLLGGSGREAAKLWDVTGGREVRRFEHFLGRISLSSDGRLVATCTRDAAKIWEVKTGQLVRTVSDGPCVAGTAFSPDGRLFATSATGAASTVRLWDTGSGKLIRTISLPVTVNQAIDLMFSPDGQVLYAGASVQNWAWEVTTGAPLKLGNIGVVSAMAFSPDGRLLAAPGYGIGLWEAKTRKYIRALGEDLKQGASSLAFSPDGRLLASGGGDGALQIWDLRAGMLVRDLSWLKSPVTHLSFSGRSQFLVACSLDGTAWVWDMASGCVVQTIKDAWWCAAFSPDGNTVFAPRRDRDSGHRLVGLRQVGTGREERSLVVDEAEETHGRPRSVIALRLSPDGRALAVGIASGPAKLIEAPTGPSSPHFSPVRPQRAPGGCRAWLRVVLRLTGGHRPGV
jgi:WD40 repeat protein